MKKTQKDLILDHLNAGKTISPLEALNLFSCFRLGARIWDLRKNGYEIENIGTDEGNFAVYRLRPARKIELPPAFRVESSNRLF
jgi:hypothetical protein